MNKLITYVSISLGWLVPALVFAQSPNTGYFDDLGIELINFFNGIVIPAIIALAVVVFLWGVFQYFILGAGNEEKRAIGRHYMLWGILGFAIIVALWGIVQIVVNLFGLTAGEGALNLPTTPSPR